MTSSPLVGPRRRPFPNAVDLLPRRLTKALRRCPVLSSSVLRWNEKRSPGSVAVPSGYSIGSVAILKTALRSASAPVRPISPQFIGAVAVRLYNHSLCTRERGGRDAIRNGGDNSAKARADGSQTSKRGRK
jgi:hypothetical protein